MMDALGEHLRLLSDETRLRILHLVDTEPLTVAELQEILDLGQSSISGHLSKMKRAGLVHDVAEGSSRRYRLREDLPAGLRAAWTAVRALVAEGAQAAADLARMQAMRNGGGESWADRIAGSLHRSYAPGRTWESLCHGLVSFGRFGRCIDIGSGDGAMLGLLSPRCTSLTCIDPNAAMIAAATDRATSLGLTSHRVRFLQSRAEDIDLPDGCADSVLFLQSLQYIQRPGIALGEAVRLLAPGGRLLVVTLAPHDFPESERYGHLHRGFSGTTLTRWCHGMRRIHVEALAPEARPPRFQTLILSAVAPS
jgi:DNA-binding transcriptional ArsR family regulator/2-polyprenyl-3-methyl-5-hydroxy-6-metoxy-1,4-benzoquinol methylase